YSRDEKSSSQRCRKIDDRFSRQHYYADLEKEWRQEFNFVEKNHQKSTATCLSLVADLMNHEPSSSKDTSASQEPKTKLLLPLSQETREQRKEMLKMLSVLRRNLQSLRKSPRVADESALPSTTVNGDRRANGVMMKFPLKIMSCFAVPRGSRADGVWVSGDYGKVSEVNHLMVCDGMRYALLM
ncbi:unnamed protein product, partial [Brassica oleracea]